MPLHDIARAYENVAAGKVGFRAVILLLLQETGCYQYMILFKSNYNIKEPRTTNCDSIQDIHVSSVHESAGTLYTCITGPMRYTGNYIAGIIHCIVYEKYVNIICCSDRRRVIAFLHSEYISKHPEERKVDE